MTYKVCIICKKICKYTFFTCKFFTICNEIFDTKMNFTVVSFHFFPVSHDTGLQFIKKQIVTQDPG